MEVVIHAGPIPSSLAVPLIDGIDSLVRPARPGETATTGPCTSCAGTGARSFRRGALRCLSSCPTCAGSGVANGVSLARVVGPEGSPVVVQFLTWAHEHGIRTDVQMAVRNQQGAGWALAWVGLDGRPLRRRRDHLVAREALAVFVDQGDIHVALHAARDDGHVVIAGLWNVRVSDDGTLIRTWSDRSSRSSAWRRQIHFFPADIIQAALLRARASRTATRPAIPQLSCSRRPRVPAGAPATSAVQTATT